MMARARSITRRVALLGLLAGLAWLPPPTTGGQTPPAPDVRVQSTFALADLPAQFEIVQHVDDFVPGAWTSPHTHGGLALGTVVSGQITWRAQGTEQTYQPGESWMELPSIVHASGNAGPGPARLLVIFLLPTGASLTTALPAPTSPPPPGPTVRYQSRFAIADPPQPADLYQQVLDYLPGAWSAARVPAGPAFVTVLEGALTLRAGDAEQTFSAGDTWIERPGTSYRSGNDGAASASAAVIHLLPAGAQPPVLPVLP